jgi:hypothetical protein
LIYDERVCRVVYAGCAWLEGVAQSPLLTTGSYVGGVVLVEGFKVFVEELMSLMLVGEAVVVGRYKSPVSMCR